MEKSPKQRDKKNGKRRKISNSQRIRKVSNCTTQTFLTFAIKIMSFVWFMIRALKQN